MNNAVPRPIGVHAGGVTMFFFASFLPPEDDIAVCEPIFAVVVPMFSAGAALAEAGLTAAA